MPAYLAACGLILWLVGRQVGTELFPQVDSGQFVLRFRAPPGSPVRADPADRREDPRRDRQGNRAARWPFPWATSAWRRRTPRRTTCCCSCAGRTTASSACALDEDSGIALAELRERLRKAVPEAVVPWLAERLEKDGLTPEQAARRAKLFALGFEPGDIVSEVMSLGSPMPVEVVVAGPNREDVRGHALKILGRNEEDPHAPRRAALPAARLPGGARRHRPPAGRAQRRDGPGRGQLRCWWARRPAATSPRTTGATRTAASITRCRSRCPRRGWTGRSRSRPCRCSKVNPDTNLMIRDVAKVRSGTAPGEVDRTSMQRYLSVIANVEGEDLGRASHRIEQAIADAGAPPRGVRVMIRGQVAPMKEMFQALGPRAWSSPCS